MELTSEEQRTIRVGLIQRRQHCEAKLREQPVRDDLWSFWRIELQKVEDLLARFYDMVYSNEEGRRYHG